MAAIHILLIDDNKQHCEDLRTMAWNFGKKKGKEVLIEYFTESVEGFKELENESKYKALILDAKGIIKKGEADSYGFLDEAFLQLDEINKKENRIYTPFVVYTGNFTEREFNDTWKRGIEKRRGKIFAKPSQSEEMLKYLLDEINKHPNTKIEIEYDDVFKAVEYLPKSPKNFRVALLKVLKEFENPVNNESVLKDVRVIQDEIYKVLRQKNSAIIPNGSFADKNKHLDGNEQWNQNQNKKLPTTTVYQTPALSYLASSIFKICSSFGNHSTSKPTNVNVEYWELPSNYAVKSVVFALLEQLIWFKKLMEKP